MNYSPSPNLISPSGHVNRSLLSPDPHDSNSNTSEQFAAGNSTPTSITTTTIDHDNHIVLKKKNFKTEYKSKFTPFDQYVYNEATDSFVKHSLEPSITAQVQNRAVSNSKSNQDLAIADSPFQTTVSISAQAADVFCPSIEGTNDNFANNEPWYKEVVRRNEKANEYRFKSEIGHNSPLSNYNNSSNATNNLRVDSPYNSERHTVSPSGTESIVGDLLTTNDDRSQISDPQNELVSLQAAESRQQFKFTPSDYRRDHLISHMANNNNFNLPKEQNEQSANIKPSSRHTPVSSSARPASRIGAQIRSRSQSTRRQPFSTTNTTSSTSAATAASKHQPTVKSNQTTPTRTVTPRATVRSHVTSTAPKTGNKLPVKNTPANTRLSSARPTTISPRTVTNLKPTPKEPVKRSPISTNSATKTTSPRATNGTSTMGNRTTPSSIEIKRTIAPARVTSARSTAPRSTNTSGIAAGRLPKTNVSAPSTRASAATTNAKNKATEASKLSAGLVTQNNAVKSIKTPKAIAAAKQAGVTAAASAAGAIALATSPALIPDNEVESKSAINQDPSSEPEVQADQEQPVTSTQMPPSERQMANMDSSNQIFSSKETGNMLSDELAQAERASISKAKTESFEQQVVSSEKNLKTVDTNFERREVDRINEGLNSNELVNGLAGGLISAEDRFDSSEKEMPEMDTNFPQLGSDDNLYNHNDADEPYSILPTTRMEAENSTSDSFGHNFGNQQGIGSNSSEDSSGKIQAIQSQIVADAEELRKNELETTVTEQPKTYDLNDSKRRPSFAISSSNDLSDKIDHHHYSASESERLFQGQGNREVSKEENRRLESNFEKPNKQFDEPLGTSEDQAVSSSQDTTVLRKESQSTDHGNETDVDIQEQQNQTWNDKSNEDIVDFTLDKERDVVDDYDIDKESDNEDSPALVEDIEQRESSSPNRQKLSESSQKPEGDGSDNDLMESKDSNEFSPALASTNTTLQESELNASKAFEESSLVKVPYENNDNNNTNTNLVQEALDEVETNLHDDIINRQLLHEQKSSTKQHEFSEVQQNKSENVGESDSDDLEAIMTKNELLMNVTDLIESESRKKLEMAKKSEIARQNISPQPPLLQSEILLSADHLTEQSSKQTDQSNGKQSGVEVDELHQPDTESEEHNELDFSEKSSLKLDNTSTNLADFDLSSAKMDKKNEDTSFGLLNDRLEDLSTNDDDSKSDKHIVDAPERSSHKEMDVNAMSEELSNFNMNDDIDNDEQLKLSNPLTNSDDELILQPRNYNYSSPRYNEGIGLEMMAQEEDRLNGSVELGDGLSAAIEQPTVAEDRVEILASKSIVPEISQTNYLFSRAEDSDEEVLDSEKNLIDAEATIGYTANVDKDELLRFNEVKEKVLEDPHQDGQFDETLSTQSAERSDGELKRDLINSAEPTNVTSDVIGGTVKQLQKHGELHRQLNKSQEERRYSSGLDEQALRGQHSSDSSSSSSTSSAKVKTNDTKSEHDEFATGTPVDMITAKNENNNTTYSSNTTSSQNEEHVHSNQTESSDSVRTATLLDQ